MIVIVRCNACNCNCAVIGVLKGYDPLVNLVLDDAVENMRGTFCRISITLFVCSLCNRLGSKISPIASNLQILMIPTSLRRKSASLACASVAERR